jgi:cytochrome bd-type quinol oxidase subunit 1
MIASTQEVLAARPTARARSPFNVAFSFILLGIVVTGFAPTFFLNAFMAQRPAPTHVLLHGLLATSWFVLLCIQALAVYRGKLSFHRAAGTVGLVIALAVGLSIVIAGALVTPRLQ